jgi:hypothetical protein
MRVISALRRQRKEDQKFQVNLGYIVRSCLQKKKSNSRPKTIREAGHGGPLCFRKILYALLCPRTELSFCLWGRPLGNSYKGSGSL